jgi:hypothetical protein
MKMHGDIANLQAPQDPACDTGGAVARRLSSGRPARTDDLTGIPRPACLPGPWVVAGPASTGVAPGTNRFSPSLPGIDASDSMFGPIVPKSMKALPGRCAKITLWSREHG